MERKIGEIVFLRNSWYQVVKGVGCNNCDIRYYDYGQYCMFKDIVALRGSCSKLIREDKQPVIFKKLEKVGEPITVNGKNVQLLRTTIANCDNCAFYKDVNCDFTCYPRKCHGGEEGTYVEI